MWNRMFFVDSKFWRQLRKTDEYPTFYTCPHGRAKRILKPSQPVAHLVRKLETHRKGVFEIYSRKRVPWCLPSPCCAVSGSGVPPPKAIQVKGALRESFREIMVFFGRYFTSQVEVCWVAKMCRHIHESICGCFNVCPHVLKTFFLWGYRRRGQIEDPKNVCRQEAAREVCNVRARRETSRTNGPHLQWSAGPGCMSSPMFSLCCLTWEENHLSLVLGQELGQEYWKASASKCTASNFFWKSTHYGES